MIPLKSNVQNKQIHRDKVDQLADKGWTKGRNQFYWNDENILELNSSDGCTTL